MAMGSRTIVAVGYPRPDRATNYSPLVVLRICLLALPHGLGIGLFGSPLGKGLYLLGQGRRLRVVLFQLRWSTDSWTREELRGLFGWKLSPAWEL